MAINFPTSPGIDDTHSASGKTWKYDGTSWNLVIASTSVGDAGAKGQKGERLMILHKNLICGGWQ